MNLQILAERMSALGLTQDEAHVYIQLCILGPTKAGDLAARIGARRSEAYRMLQNLVQRGFVTATLSRPTRFEAAPAEHLFAETFAAHEATWEHVARTRDEIFETLVDLRARSTGGPSESGKPTFRLLQGRLDGLRAAEQLLRCAQRSVRIFSTGAATAGLATAEPLWDLANRRAQDGVVVEAALGRIAARTTGPVVSPGLTVRETPLDRPIQFLVGDARELVAWVVTEAGQRRKGSGDVIVWSDAPDFVATYLGLFELAWQGAAVASPRAPLAGGRGLGPPGPATGDRAGKAAGLSVLLDRRESGDA